MIGPQVFEHEQSGRIVVAVDAFDEEATARVEIDFLPGNPGAALRLLCRVVLATILQAKRDRP